ncbi:MAG: ABC transporter ATP-binding protein [Stellaceae bacterium]
MTAALSPIPAPSPQRPLVALSKVYLAFVTKGNQAKLALDDINLAIAPGEFCSVIGPSGCGKSTILNLVAGLIRPSDGSVAFDGRPVERLNTDVGYVTQDDNLLPWRSLRANVELALELRNVPREERMRRSQELIRRVGLEGFENHLPAQLSGGMRKRASIIRTLIYDTRAVLMDEPFGALDAQTRLILQRDLLDLWERARPTIIFVTHDITEAIALSDRVVVMSKSPGRIKRIHTVDIPRPRDVFRIHESPRFASLYQRLWAEIREEMGAEADDGGR